VYALIEQLTLEGAFPLLALCDVLQVSRAGYYAWHAEHETANQRRDRELTPVICDTFWHHKRRYGARRIAVELQARGLPCGVDRVSKLLKMQGLQHPTSKSCLCPPGLDAGSPLAAHRRLEPGGPHDRNARARHAATGHPPSRQLQFLYSAEPNMWPSLSGENTWCNQDRH
jgi:hypothetical protein